MKASHFLTLYEDFLTLEANKKSPGHYVRAARAYLAKGKSLSTDELIASIKSSRSSTQQIRLRRLLNFVLSKNLFGEKIELDFEEVYSPFFETLIHAFYQVDNKAYVYTSPINQFLKALHHQTTHLFVKTYPKDSLRIVERFIDWINESDLPEALQVAQMIKRNSSSIQTLREKANGTPPPPLPVMEIQDFIANNPSLTLIEQLLLTCVLFHDIPVTNLVKWSGKDLSEFLTYNPQVSFPLPTRLSQPIFPEWNKIALEKLIYRTFMNAGYPNLSLTEWRKRKQSL